MFEIFIFAILLVLILDFAGLINFFKKEYRATIAGSIILIGIFCIVYKTCSRETPMFNITNNASNNGFQGIANAPVTINNGTEQRPPIDSVVAKIKSMNIKIIHIFTVNDNKLEPDRYAEKLEAKLKLLGKTVRISGHSINQAFHNPNNFDIMLATPGDSIYLQIYPLGSHQ